MAERMVDPEANAPEEDIDDVLKTVIRAVLDEAATKMEAGEEVIPFTGLAVKENLFIETHPGDDVEECFLAARREVEGARVQRLMLSAMTDILKQKTECVMPLLRKADFRVRSRLTPLVTFMMQTG